MMSKEQKGVSRREFLKRSAAVGAGAAGAGVLSALTTGAAGSVAFAETIDWDYEVDLVIIGYGGAGVTAAIEAKRAGISFLVIEKDEIARGGNTGCTGGFNIGQTEEGGQAYFKSLCWGTTPDKVVEAHVKAFFEFPAFVDSLGLTAYYSSASPVYAMLPGADEWAGPECSYRLTPPGENVNKSWGLVRDAAVAEGISVDDGNIFLTTPATKLIQDPDTKEILGVKALKGVTIQKPSYSYTGGTEINIKANKAVILACGGYENNAEMRSNFGPHVHGAFVTFYGTPYNTGDGIKMAQEVGAKLWHMNKKECHALACMEASKEIGVGVVVEAYGAKAGARGASIFVNRFGERFQNESFFSGHTDREQAWDEFTHQLEPDDPTTYSDYRNNPFFWIFDQTMMDAGPILSDSGGLPFRFAPQNGLVEWSEDNEAELAKGWIIKADTIEELAQKLVVKDFFGRTVGIDPAALAETVDNWNAYCATGEDLEFARPMNRMLALDNGPFYAMELAECQTNTDGGPARNEYCQTLDTDGNPIPKLYSVGELGSFFGFLYNGGGNIPEAYATGRMAVAHILTL